MRYPIAIEIGDEEYAYSVAVPDLKGCFSAGDTLEEALINAKEAILFHLEDLAARGIEPPIATSLDFWVENEEYTGWVWSAIDV